MKKLEILFGILRIPIDIIAIMGALFLAYFLRPYTDLIPGIQYYFDPGKLPTLEYFFLFACFACATLIIIFATRGHYSLKSTYRLSRTFVKIFSATLVWLMAIIAYYFLVIHELFFSRIILAHSFIFTILFVFLGRAILHIFQIICLKNGFGKRNLLFVGVNKDTQKIFQELKDDAHYAIAGAVDQSKRSTKKDELNIIGTLSEIQALTKKRHIDEIICTPAVWEENQVDAIIDFCQEEHIGYRFIPTIQGFNYARIDMEFFSGLPLIDLQPTPLEGWGRVIKRIFDIFASTLGLIILFPFFVLIGILIKIDSPGPIFYKSKRVGQAGKSMFFMYKFRSMRTDADKLKKDLMHKNQRKGPLFKIKDDPRITKLGKFLRRSTIDELPQLINVFKGELSLVGPRAHLPEEVAQYKKHHKLVLGIKPGVTGLAQINGRSDLDFEDEVKFDVFYIKNWTFWMDIKIIIKTIGVVFGGKGAD